MDGRRAGLFFAAAIVCRTAARNYVEEAKQIAFAPARLRLAISIAFVLAFTMVCGSGIRAMNAVLQERQRGRLIPHRLRSYTKLPYHGTGAMPERT
jgi:hypothetical protein